jgi:hypothetical protein
MQDDRGSGAQPRRKNFVANTPADLPVVVQKAYELSVWLIRKVENFPRSYRFSVGDRLVLNLLNVDSYGHAAEWVEEIGRMVGGWRKASAGAGPE